MMKPGKVYKLTKGEVALFPDAYCEKRTGSLISGNKFLILEPSNGVDKLLFNGIIYYAYISDRWVEEVDGE